MQESTHECGGGGGRTREGPQGGGIFHWGGVYYGTRGGGEGGFMIGVMVVHKSLMSDV